MDIFNFIKSNVSILDVAKQYASIKKAGLYWKGHCPFHHEKTASFTVSPHREIFYCFGCSSGGDVITFIAKVEQCSAIEAVKILADRYNIDLPEDTTAQQLQLSGSANEKERYFKLCRLVADWCHEQLKKNTPAKEYLAGRNILNESIAYFTVGFFPSGLSCVQSLIQYAQRRQVLADDLIQANILNAAKNVLYSPFEGRIIFPIKDHLGRFCGFGGRIFRKDDNRAKYYNSKENNYFTKSQLLFGLDLAKQSIQKNKTVFLVEGYTDCVAMYQYGYENSVATLGTACTSEHLQLLSRYAEQLHVLYDGDSAGTQAILRLAGLCWQADVDLKVLRLPSSEDPATYLAKHNSIGSILAEAKEIFDFFIDTVAHDFHTKPLKQKLGITRKILEIIVHLSDPLKRDILTQRIANTVGLPFESIKDELRRTVNKQYPPREASTSPIASSDKKDESLDQLPALEKRIFFAILHNMQLLGEENEDFVLAYLPAPINAMVQKIKELRAQDKNLSFNAFFDQLDTQNKRIVTQLLVSFDQTVKKKEFAQLLTQLQKKYWKQIVKDIQVKLDYAKKSENQLAVDTILQRFIKLKKQMTRGLL